MPVQAIDIQLTSFILAMTLKGVYSTGYAVLAATAVSSVVAAFFL
jgi:hypothetical protein